LEWFGKGASNPFSKVHFPLPDYFWPIAVVVALDQKPASALTNRNKGISQGKSPGHVKL